MRNLTSEKDRVRFGSDGMSYKQLSLFDDAEFTRPVTVIERQQTAVGQL